MRKITYVHLAEAKIAQASEGEPALLPPVGARAEQQALLSCSSLTSISREKKTFYNGASYPQLCL